MRIDAALSSPTPKHRQGRAQSALPSANPVVLAPAKAERGIKDLQSLPPHVLPHQWLGRPLPLTQEGIGVSGEACLATFTSVSSTNLFTFT